MSPTIMEHGPYRFRFYSTDICHHPLDPHIHAYKRNGANAKIRLETVQVVYNRGLKKKDLPAVEELVRVHRVTCWNVGMRSSTPVDRQSRVEHAEVVGAALRVWLRDGRMLTVPLGWFPRLYDRAPAERNNHVLAGDGHAIHRPDLDEDIGVVGLLAGRSSGEHPRSLGRWLLARRENRSVSDSGIVEYERALPRPAPLI